ncbi:hypothetical protein I4F81_000350 [Pyropia yezoensis]|uniref:Uncharacterized protein n=1 Tax=Pyropia yezoensis TaxID=2788 RepID=A0ACC3BIZ5_PYRYE|nr:hypothetical protein I4F81_000350 [Neopyropia yezoensis]
MTAVAAILRRHGGVGSAIEAVRTLPSQQQVLLAALAAALAGASRGGPGVVGGGGSGGRRGGGGAAAAAPPSAAGASVPLDALHARYVALATRLRTCPVGFADAVDMVGGALSSAGLRAMAQLPLLRAVVGAEAD